MIKFYRKIRQKLLSQGKTGKYFKYAIGEIVLIVIGILVALSINNWNEKRKNQELEENILRGIKNDFQETIDRLNVTIKNQKEVVRWSIALSNLIEKEMSIEKSDSIDFYYSYGALSYYRVEPVLGTYDALIGSGNTSIIRNKELLNSLSQFSAITKLEFEDETASMDLLKLIQESTNEYAYILLPNFYRQNLGLERTYSEEEKRGAIKKLITNKAFLSYLLERINYEENRLTRQKTLLKFASEVLAQIETNQYE